MHHSAPFRFVGLLLLVAACRPASKLDIAPEYTTPGAYRCTNCPDLPGAVTTQDLGAVTRTELSGTVQSAVGNGRFYVLGRNGEEVAGTLVTDASGAFSTNVPLFCGEQLVKCLWSNDAGRYVLVRRVITTDCIDADVRVTLSWDDKARDLELHLVKPGGKINDAKTDCTWTTCVNSQPEWGVAGDNSDNPKKDVDDTGSFGPENIFLAKPESGTFNVLVEHWAAGEPMNDARLIINVKGKEATVLDHQNLTSHFVWHAATVQWPAGTVTKVDTTTDCTNAWSSGCTLALP